MESRIPFLADQLLLIEGELRQLGWWMPVSPSAEALASEQPFCIDTLDFEAWLQWVFLPRMKRIIEDDLELPAASGILPMAEEVYRERLTEAGRLLALLGEFDRLVSAVA